MWAGDDAAVVRGPETLLITTDMLVEDVDFRLPSCRGEDIGWKALAVNVSDIAAMGGRPLHAVTALGLGPRTPRELVDGVLAGLMLAAEEWDVSLVGGDISSAPALTLSIAVTGAPSASGPVLRSGARPGDLLGVTGALGGAGAGLWLSEHPQPGLPDGTRERLLARQFRPRARVPAGQALAAAGAGAMIDISDGLLMDLERVLDASGCGCEVEETTIPVDDSALELGRHEPEAPDPLRLALTGGEDFELLFAIAEEGWKVASSALETQGTAGTIIGRVTEEGRLIGGRALEEREERGWDHLRDR